MKAFVASAALMAAFFVSSNAYTADVHPRVQAAIRANVAPLLTSPIQKIGRAPFGDMYEVITEHGIGYTDSKGTVLMFGGSVIETATQDNMVEKRMAQLSPVAFSDFPLGDAIKTVIGSGRRVVVTFEDPNCTYCRQLAAEVPKLKDVTIYTFVMPVMAPDSLAKARTAWCSKDRAAAWRAVLSGANMSGDQCDHPFERNIALGQKHRVMGTPTFFFPDGTRISRMVGVDRLNSELDRQKGAGKSE